MRLLRLVVLLLGDTLRRPPLSVEDGQRLIGDLQVARGEYAAHPATVAHRLAVARRTVALGRMREALDLYTQAAHRQFDDPRPLSLGQASGPEEFSRAAFWLWLAMQRAGAPAEAATSRVLQCARAGRAGAHH